MGTLYERHGERHSFQNAVIKATIAATDAIRAVDSDCRFIQVDPFMYREAIEPASPEARNAARDFNDIARFQTWDMLSGKTHPELGGKPDYLDILGINYYVDNQQWLLHQMTRSILFSNECPSIIPSAKHWANA